MQAVAVVIVVVAERRNIGATTQSVAGCSRFKISVQTTPCLSPRRPGTDRILGATNRCKHIFRDTGICVRTLFDEPRSLGTGGVYCCVLTRVSG